MVTVFSSGSGGISTVWPVLSSGSGSEWLGTGGEAIGIGISYEANHLTTLFRAKGFREGQFPVSERIARETVTLPLFPEMRASDVERVCESMDRVLRRKAA